MNFQFYLEKLLLSEEFKNFKEKYQDAYLCSGFFSIDKTGKEKGQQHLDFFVPSLNKMFSFQLENDLNPVPIETYDKRIPKKLRDNIDFDFEEVERMFVRKMEKEKVNKSIQKILFSLQGFEDKEYIIATLFVSSMGIVKITYDINMKKVISFEKKSFFDLLKITKK